MVYELDIFFKFCCRVDDKNVLGILSGEFVDCGLNFSGKIGKGDFGLFYFVVFEGINFCWFGEVLLLNLYIDNFVVKFVCVRLVNMVVLLNEIFDVVCRWF